MLHRCTPRADSLTVNQQGLWQISVSQMTDEKDETCCHAERSVARRRPWYVVADCSMPALQPQETRGHRELIDGLTAPASPESRQSAEGDEQQRLMSAAGCQPDTPVLCRAHRDMPEHTAGTGFALGRIASAAPEAVESCAMISDANRRVEQRHLARTEVSLADVESLTKSLLNHDISQTIVGFSHNLQLWYDSITAILKNRYDVRSPPMFVRLRRNFAGGCNMTCG